MGQTGLINAKVHATKSRRNFSLRTHPIHTMGPEAQVFIAFPKVWVHFELFRYCTKLGGKWAKPV